MKKYIIGVVFVLAFFIVGVNIVHATNDVVAPTEVSFEWGNGIFGTYTRKVFFEYDSDVSNVSAFRIYLKKPGETTYSAVATFSDPSSWLPVPSGSCSSSRDADSGPWHMRNCHGWSWQTSEGVHEPSWHTKGKYSAYVVALDSSGIEGPASSIVHNTILDDSTLLEPTGFAPLTPTFRWSVPSGWTTVSTVNSATYMIVMRVADTGEYIWMKVVHAPFSATEASVVYDGPALDPSKRYVVFARGDTYYPVSETDAQTSFIPLQEFSIDTTIDATAPTITNVQVTDITSGSATIIWTTDEAATSKVEYGVSATSENATSEDIALVTSHSVALTGLSANTTYTYQVVSKDAADNMALSQDATFTTLVDITPPSAPTSPDAGFSVGSSVSMWGTAGQNVSFIHDISVETNTDAFRLYEKKPGATSFTLVGEFSDLPTLTCAKYRVFNEWGLTVSCGEVGRRWVAQRMNSSGTQSGLYPASFYSVGAHSYYVTALNNLGEESPASEITSMHFLGPITILSPTEAQSPVSSNPIFQWTTVSGWPSGMWTGPYFISIAEEGASTVFWSASWLEGNSKVYDGPTLDPGKTYIVHMYGYWEGGSSDPLNSYFALESSTSRFWISPPPPVVDTTPPSIPTNLVASPISSSQIDLSWSPSTDNIEVAGYKVYRDGIYVASTPGTTYDSTGLNPSTTYSYKVAAYDTAGNISAKSSSVSTTTLVLSSPPPPPPSLTEDTAELCSDEIDNDDDQLIDLDDPDCEAFLPPPPVIDTIPPSVPTNLSASPISVSQIDLSWSPSTDNVGVVGYKVYRDNILIFSVADTSFPDNNLSDGTTYSYKVAAYDAAGNLSAQSLPVSATTLLPPPVLDTTPPAISNVRVENITDASAQIKWITDEPSDSSVLWGVISGDYSNVSEYRCDNSGDVTTHCINLTGLTAATRYYYKAVSRDPSGNEAMSYGLSFVSTSLTATIKGTVTDYLGQAVGSVGVRVYKEDLSSNYGTFTASDGSYSLDIPPGTYLIEISSPSNRTDLAEPTPVRFGVASGQTRILNLRFARTSKIIVGRVLFSNSQPVTDAEVGAYSSQSGQWVNTVVDTNGDYTLSVGRGKWMVNIRPRDPATARWTWSEPPIEIEFAADNRSETKSGNFLVPLPDTTLVVQAVDENGSPISSAGVVVDAVSGGFPTIGGYVPPEFRRTDSTGKATFTLKVGTYYIRASLPPERGYINPAEQKVTLPSGQTYHMLLVFRKPNVVTSVLLNGITRLEDGAPTEAFVWAWSEKGRYVESRSGADGKFSFRVSANDRWHIGAGKELHNFHHKSSEFTIDIEDAPVFIELILNKVREEPLPPPVSASQAATQEIVVQSSDGARTTLPPSAAAPSGTVTLEMKPTIEAPSQAATKVMGTAYDITVKDAVGREITELIEEAEIILPYDEIDLTAQRASEDSIISSFFDELTGVWARTDNYTIDKEKNIIIVRAKHLTRFAIVAAADITPPNAPSGISAANLGGGEIKLTWQNPMRDFDHAKVYRSEEPGELGVVRAAEIFVQEFIDTVVGGVTYYYTVRAVDPAGNESGNTNQIAFVVGAGGSKPAATVSAAKFTRSLSVGFTGDDVKVLQQLLINEGVYPEALVTGYFGSLTKAAVIRFQEKYFDEILAPVSLAYGTGYFGPSTLAKANALLGTEVIMETKPEVPDLEVAISKLTRNLSVGVVGDDVKFLQLFLLAEGVYPEGLITGYFGPLTKRAVILFQEKYFDEILAPVDLSQGTGYVGPMTINKINQLVP